MSKSRLSRLPLIFLFSYMLLAVCWWAFLLLRTNDDAFKAKEELLKMGMVAEGIYHNQQVFESSEQYIKLQQDYKKQKMMILSETIGISLGFLLFSRYVYQAYRRRILLSEQQRNFLLSITHELKSPLAGVRLALETIVKQFNRLKQEQIERLSANGIKDVDRLSQLVENILFSARLEDVSHQFHKEEFDMGAQVGAIVKGFQVLHPKRALELKVDADLPSYNGDEQAMSSVVINLIENAAKYSAKDSPIAVALSKDENRNALVFSVSDTGIGISEEEKQRIFEKFYRVGSEDTRKTKGTGLGLFIVHEIVKRHNGTIEITDNTPKGTVFTILLPLTK